MHKYAALVTPLAPPTAPHRSGKATTLAALVAALLGMLTVACQPASPAQGGPGMPLAPPTPYHLYVATNGSDSNLGSESAPFLTIERAAKVAFPGTTVHVAPGTYPGGFTTTASGTATARIYYIAARPGHARIVPPAQSSSVTAWDNRGSYVDIVGFDIDGRVQQNGMPWRNGLYSAGSFDSLRHNSIHHIATGTECPDSDGAGLTLESYFKGSNGEAIGNKIYDVGARDCPAVHGIAINSPALVANNLVFRTGHAGIFMWHDAHHVRVRNNTITGATIGIVVGAGNFFGPAGSNDFTDVSNNIVFDNDRGIVERGATGPHNVYRSNLVYHNQAGDWGLAPAMRHAGSVAAAPGFEAYSRDGMPDFRPRAGSAAIGRGDPAHAHPVDFNGKRRAGPVDIGAIEH